MEPVFMVLGQSSAVAASIAIDKKLPVQGIDVESIQKILKENPLLDGSQPDIVVDDADKTGVVIKGNWKKLTTRSYGHSMLVSDFKTNELASVRFKPAIKKAGSYSLYSYFSKVQNMADEFSVIIYDGIKTHLKKVKPNEIDVKGQTSGEWIYLGDFNFANNNKSYIEISNKESQGVVVADAVLLKKKNRF
jgi:hypothetical protein